jgi:hypothetical protein
MLAIISQYDAGEGVDGVLEEYMGWEYGVWDI